MKRRLVIIDETAKIGGAEINLSRLASGLQRLGWEVEVILPETGPLVDMLAGRGLACNVVPGGPFYSVSIYLGWKTKLPNPFAWLATTWNGIRWGYRLKKHLQEAQPTIVMTVSLLAHLIGGTAARRCGLPVVAHIQDIVAPESGFGLYRWILNTWAKRIPDRIVCVSPIVAEQFGAAHKPVILWNSVDTSSFSTHIEMADDAPILTIGSVGRLTPWKGHHIAIEAAQALRDQELPFRWFIVGDASLGDKRYAQKLYAAVRCSGLTDQVHFLGWKDDMPAFYRSLDLLVHLPTEAEPFGLVLAEAMACGIPVVATQGGGLDPIIPQGGGILVPPGDVDSVVETIIRLWQEPQDRRRRALLARESAVKYFSAENSLQQWIDLFTALSEPSM